ncbi:MAG: plasmid recombination protein [Oscillospiraceae bacterium]|nr:plasmid recombination protein [Oscillospiraceae bacterium]
MLGKGSVNHNSRKFIASNIDKDRSQYNIEYRNESIKDVYNELFIDAVIRYNEKQTRSDRYIFDYYEKIRSSKQEKLFHEVILQIGNKDNMTAAGDNGKLSAKILDEYMKDFENRNPNIRVFSAHLHMDEATPHLHIDFVPFTTGSKRGLDTRVSLKQALAAQGFTGGTRSDTEWNQWVKSEKEQLALVMERHGIEWEQLGTHHEHLSVLDYKKEQRAGEVVELDAVINDKKSKVTTLDSDIADKQVEVSSLIQKKDNAQDELSGFLNKVANEEKKFKSLKDREKFIAKNASHYDSADYDLPEPKPLMSAKSYRDNIVFPVFKNLKDVIRRVLLQYFEKTRELQSALNRANDKLQSFTKRIDVLVSDNSRLKNVECDHKRVRSVLGDDRVNELIDTAISCEYSARELQLAARKERNRDYTR